MKNKRPGKSSVSVAGVIAFFVLVAVIIQIAILTYDFIETKTENNGLIAILVLILVVILSTVIILCDIIRRKIMIDKPVKKILTATDKVANGDFNVELEIEHTLKNYNEYDFIMENLNKMFSELRKSEILKTDFISNVSHELKTPLFVIQSYAKQLEKGGLDKETEQKYAKSIVEASKRLSELISNILKLNKLENQDYIKEKEKVNLAESIANTVINFEEIIEYKEINLECDLDDVCVTSVPSYLEIVWSNLLSNAIKFTDKGGHIRISLKTENSQAIIKFIDTGCGISKEEGKRIFEKFYQAETSHSKEGNGLGLALIKKVIDILGGEISVESEVGRGSTFTIILEGN
ncbi:MAG: GHKL domain-containing protein [Clostridia bacterium]|nr:GHKL domain-containing protein [Clostridia bacterium]